MKQVRKAIIPAAGLGTRFLPATKAMPKEMLPVVDKPTIQYIVEEAVKSGIEDIIFVTGRNKRSIEDHFDRNWELEMALKEKGKPELVELVESIANLADVHYVRQKQALGLGHAILCARKFIGDEPFAVLLGDIILDSQRPGLRQLLDLYDDRRSSVLAVEQVAEDEVDKYGVIDGLALEEGVYLVKGLVEKPKQNPPSRLAIVGRYVLEPAIFDLLEHTPPGIGGEIQLTDALQELAYLKPLYALQVEGRVFDIGDKMGYLKATVEFAYKNGAVKEPFRKFLKAFVDSREP